MGLLAPDAKASATLRCSLQSPFAG